MNNIDKEYLRKLINDIEEAINIILEDTSKPFEMLIRSERSEVRYYIVVLVEALIALCYHIIRRKYGVKPMTPFQTFNVLVEKHLIKPDEFDDFVKLVRLRNLLVHRYWIVNDKLIYDNIKKNFSKVKSFLERVRHEFGI
ncbi:MAG: DUF86 domain-containing protein [Thermoprotei archaeon]|nr:DUF86 domain-containing protein [Thermoprotei archaeon]